jgi:hypothetical protein
MLPQFTDVFSPHRHDDDDHHHHQRTEMRRLVILFVIINKVLAPRQVKMQ